jgi:hypothetical protein
VTTCFEDYWDSTSIGLLYGPDREHCEHESRDGPAKVVKALWCPEACLVVLLFASSKSRAVTSSHVNLSSPMVRIAAIMALNLPFMECKNMIMESYSGTLADIDSSLSSSPVYLSMYSPISLDL